MEFLKRLCGIGALALALCLVLPLMGRWLGPASLEPLWQFPPPLDIPDHPRFSWWAVLLILGALLLLLLPWVLIRRAGGERAHADRGDISSDGAGAAESSFPLWGWMAVGWTLVWWWIAWSRGDIFAVLREHSFLPLWLGFVMTVNGIAVWRTGSSFATRHPIGWLGLFLASAAFWWVFEWLNRFVSNWHYLGVSHFSGLRYALHASSCFATVLPAVLAVRETIGAPGRLQRALSNGPILRRLDHPATAVALVLLGLAGLFGMGRWPTIFYPAVWASPLALLWGLRRLFDSNGMLRDLAAGDWRRPASWALAALVCGFFWELWNLHSMPKWIYTVPYADRWHLFEMPLLGYLGYLPFGIVCGWTVEALTGKR